MRLTQTQVRLEIIERLRLAVRTKDNVQGLTHNYYRYPARFSPKFVREIISIFSKEGDVILDPFAGGGTTLVEALASNRHSIGFDVSPIATFVSHAKTTLLLESDLIEISNWANESIKINIKGYKITRTFYDEEGYLNNLPWQIRACVEILLNQLPVLPTEQQQTLARCMILKTAQWAFDCRMVIPPTKDFREKFMHNLSIFRKGITELSKAVFRNSQIAPKCISVNGTSEKINSSKELKLLPTKPKLVITSPPYVGVHMNYHQWQVESRKRTRAPFWIINSLDGQGSSFYTFGYYKTHVKNMYFEIAEKVFKAIYTAIADDALVVQLVGFSNPTKYLPKYLEMMAKAGYEEQPILVDRLNRTKRIWRNVPNRKWYVTTKDKVSSTKEVLLIHRKKLKHGNQDVS